MKLLEERILRDGQILPGDVLRVGHFLNQQMDVVLMTEMGKEIARLYEGRGVTKVLTVEASGIALAFAAAAQLGVPMVFAKKHASANMSPEVYSTTVASYTHGRTYQIVVASEYITENDNILLVDDFLAMGNALHGMIDLCAQGGARVEGIAVAIEKWYQKGGDTLRKQGYRVESLAKIRTLSATEGITFCEN
ncbi:MAG: xanthine phosphoribosyltransferase [Clostridia bacterium]|nr:xanthine phosphoribosyltransferase [Clostridia bacterium]